MDPKGAARPLLVAGKSYEYLDAAHLTLLTLDHRGRVSHINRTGCEMPGREEADILGMDWFGTFVPSGTGSAMRGLFGRTMAGADVDAGHFESPAVSRSRGERLIAWQAAPIRLAGRRVTGMILSGLDVTEQERSTADRERLLKELGDVKFALDQSAIVAMTDVTGAITAVNDKFCEISKYSREELLGQDHRIVNSGYHGREFFRDLWATIARGGIWKGEIRNRTKDGTFLRRASGSPSASLPPSSGAAPAFIRPGSRRTTDRAACPRQRARRPPPHAGEGIREPVRTLGDELTPVALLPVACRFHRVTSLSRHEAGLPRHGSEPCKYQANLTPMSRGRLLQRILTGRAGAPGAQAGNPHLAWTIPPAPSRPGVGMRAAIPSPTGRPRRCGGGFDVPRTSDDLRHDPAAAHRQLAALLRFRPQVDRQTWHADCFRMGAVRRVSILRRVLDSIGR